MRIEIQPIDGLPGQSAKYFSCDSMQLVRGNVASRIAFWSDDGRKLHEETKVLPQADYVAWCATGPEADDEAFLTRAHAAALGLVEILPPAQVPDDPPVDP